MGVRSWKAGIDFGSTYSSAAFCLVSGRASGAKPRQIYSVYCSNYIPGRSKNEQYEFPTMLVYEGNKPTVHWGSHASSIVKKIRGNHIDLEQQIHVFENFKPLLQGNFADSLLEERLARLPFHKSIEDVVTDYLSGLVQLTKHQMKHCGYREGDLVHFICTVPAMWTDRAKQATMASAETAINYCEFTNGSVSLCYEPVAAAAYVSQVDKTVDLEKNDAFIVVDGGGATVDLITYITKSVSPLRVSEVVQGKGGHCGSTYLNKYFEADVTARLATESYLWSQPNSKSLNSIIQTSVMEEFEIVTKRAYPNQQLVTVNEDWYTSYTIPGLLDNDHKCFRRGDMGFTRDQLEDVFRPVLSECWLLIADQLDRAREKGVYPDRVVLVGGLARSCRYQSYIEQKCVEYTAKHAPGFPIQIVIPRTCESAIAQGAVRYFLNNDFVQDYITRSCICITRNLQEDQSAQELQSAVFRDDLDGKNYIRNCVHILLGADEVIPSTGRTETKRLYRILASDEDEVAIAIPIYVFERQNAIPDHPLELQSDQAHYLLTTVEFAVDMAPIRHQLKKMKTGTFKPFHLPKPVRRSGRSHSQNGLTSHAASAIIPNIGDSGSQISSSGQGPSPSYYYLVDFTFKVEFIAGWMKYHLKIENVESSEGWIMDRLNLAAVVDPC